MPEQLHIIFRNSKRHFIARFSNFDIRLNSIIYDFHSVGTNSPLQLHREHILKLFSKINVKNVAKLSLAYAPFTHIRTLTESFGSNRNRPQKNEGGA